MTHFLLILATVLAQASGDPVIESIEGAEIVAVSGPSGQRQVPVGTALGAGDVIRTGPESMVHVRYDDGTQLVIGHSSEVEIQARSGETRWSRLGRGEARGVVPKTAEPAPGAPPRPFRFAIRSRAVVMGVRGTEFVIEADPLSGEARIHTLEGHVEAADDEPSLLSGRGFAIRRNEMVEKTRGKLQRPRRFDRARFMKRLEARRARLNKAPVAKKKPEGAARKRRVRPPR